MRFICLSFLILLMGCADGQLKTEPSVTPGNTLAFKIPPPLGYVSDYENKFDPEEEARIDSLIQVVNGRGKIQLGFASFDSTYASDSSFSAFARAVANDWGVGEKGKNNGIFICVSLTMRNIQIKTGLGIEKSITDEMVKEVIDATIIPAFKALSFTKGICAGILALSKLADDRIR